MKRTTDIKVHVEYGSDFQEEVWEKAIETALKAIQATMEKAHKSNMLNWDTYTK